eukprot:Plantae.Rhodophyta-Palmaria_palmata.ctg1959.p1 GENE.Plantae.Rhodophyta-Palmaria_palmata.ctg1959~~Plantae.Rhodophyta-Palmaria_palmata.ctg1959.p1  ORF type:complete len:124 (-),score=1.12 Plantae.Rhodophyta-Palmaria_palmata.ctg1959:237-608(-)
MSCTACIEGKAKRRSFRNTSGNRYAPLEAMSIDTTGPLSEEDVHGNRYLQLLCDAGTGFLMGEPMKHKSSASNVIVRALARLKLVCGKIVKRLYTDGAEEQNTAELKHFLDPQGTQRTRTAPN